MRRRPSPLLLLFVAVVALAPMRLMAQTNPYSATVPVIDTSDAQRDHAFAVALGQVLGQVAGKDLSANPGYTDALGQAPSYVMQYQYGRAQTGAVAPFTLTVSFDPSAVRRLVAGMGAPAWSGPDAPVLLRVRGTDSTLLGADALAPLIQSASVHGIQTRVASLDDPDAAALASADPNALAQVSQRYHTGLVLVGTLGDGNAVWTLVAAGRASRWTDRASDPQQLLADAGGALVQHLMQQFSAGGAGGGGSGTLWVSGVHSGADFAALLGVLRGDDAVKSADVSSAQGDGVLLDVVTTTSLASIVNDLSAGGRMLPDTTSHPGADASLRWLH